MSSTYRIPPLTRGDSLTPSGETLDAFMRRQARDLLDSGQLDEPSTPDALGNLRAFYALVVKTPPVMTTAEFINADYRRAEVLWLNYLTTLDPVDRARAEAAQEAAPPAQAARTVSLTENTHQEQPTMQSIILTHDAMHLTESGEAVVEYLTKQLRTGIAYETDTQRNAIHAYVSLCERARIAPAEFFHAFPQYAATIAYVCYENAMASVAEQLKGAAS